jgi:hypothetical protein
MGCEKCSGCSSRMVAASSSQAEGGACFWFPRGKQSGSFSSKPCSNGTDNRPTRRSHPAAAAAAGVPCPHLEPHMSPTADAGQEQMSGLSAADQVGHGAAFGLFYRQLCEQRHCLAECYF